MDVFACSSMMVVFRTVDGDSFFGASMVVDFMSLYAGLFWTFCGGSFSGVSMVVLFLDPLWRFVFGPPLVLPFFDCIWWLFFWTNYGFSFLAFYVGSF